VKIELNSLMVGAVQGDIFVLSINR